MKWINIKDHPPDDNETVWLLNIYENIIAIGCQMYIRVDDDNCGYVWALSDGSFYIENGRIQSECHPQNDTTFTHWCALPLLK